MEYLEYSIRYRYDSNVSHSDLQSSNHARRSPLHNLQPNHSSLKAKSPRIPTTGRQRNSPRFGRPPSFSRSFSPPSPGIEFLKQLHSAGRQLDDHINMHQVAKQYEHHYFAPQQQQQHEEQHGAEFDDREKLYDQLDREVNGAASPASPASPLRRFESLPSDLKIDPNDDPELVGMEIDPINGGKAEKYICGKGNFFVTYNKFKSDKFVKKKCKFTIMHL